MKSPKYLDLLDAARWGFANKRIEEEGKKEHESNEYG